MTHKYQNVEFTPQQSAFVDITQPNPLKATFASRKVNVKVDGGQFAMVRAQVLVQEPFLAVPCGETCGTELTRSVKLEVNVEKGGASIADLRAEVIRLFDQAMTNYGLAEGYVPPAYANFTE